MRHSIWLLVMLLAAPAFAQAPEAPPAEVPAEEAPEAPPAEIPAEETLEALPIVSGPDVLEFVEATYPPEAMEQGLEAVVVLLVELDDTGALVSLEVVGPAGHGFDEAAIEAVRQMKFGTAMTEEGPVPVLFELPYGFRFDVEEPPEEEDAPPPPVNLDGTVIEMGTRRPVQNARV
ncbi:MAG: energy transducer TonB, partial [Deltaproteobacteria bacterium]|nr:energy transducer TonB [Deltaproteobacteria bacterium]